MPELLDVLTNSAVYVIRARLAVIASELAANLIFTCSAPVGCCLTCRGKHRQNISRRLFYTYPISRLS
jgi:hypothetical protein